MLDFLDAETLSDTEKTIMVVVIAFAIGVVGLWVGVEELLKLWRR